MEVWLWDAGAHDGAAIKPNTLTERPPPVGRVLNEAKSVRSLLFGCGSLMTAQWMKMNGRGKNGENKAGGAV